MNASWPTTVLAVAMASICSLLLGMHLQREYLSPWGPPSTLVSRVAAKTQNASRADSVGVPGGKVQGSPTGTPMPCSSGSLVKPAVQLNGARSQQTAAKSSASGAKGGSPPPQKAKHRQPRSKPRRPAAAGVRSQSVESNTSVGVVKDGSQSPQAAKQPQPRSKAAGRPAAGLRSQRVSCSTLPLPEKWRWYRIYNPAGVFDPARGWVVLVRHELEWFGPSPTLAVLMGKDRNAPDAATAASHQMLLQMDNATLGRAFAQKQYGKAWLKSEDLRPFLWKGGIYAAASVWGENSTVTWECILKVDLDHQLLRTEYCFDKLPIQAHRYMEKNWALAVVHDSLIFLHQLAPCLVWLRYAPAAPKGLELFQMTCLSDEAHLAMLDFTGTALTYKQHISGLLTDFPESLIKLDMLQRGVIGSRKQQHTEYFLMAHVRHGDGHFKHQVYSHWGFRINAATLQLTHVSRGPIVSSYMARRPHDYLTVMSYHFVRRQHTNGLLVFYGRNDTTSCYDTLPAEEIDWYQLDFGVNNVDITDPSKLGFELT